MEYKKKLIKIEHLLTSFNDIDLLALIAPMSWFKYYAIRNEFILAGKTIYGRPPQQDPLSTTQNPV